MDHPLARGTMRVFAFILLCIGAQISWVGFAALISPIIDAQSLTKQESRLMVASAIES
jgi:transcriptional regulator CtsR